LEELAWNMQNRSAEWDEWGGMELTIDRKEAVEILGSVEELYRAASANLVEDAEHVRFTHQLMQEYFTARRMLGEVIAGRLKGEDLWPKKSWWQPSGWDEAAILAVGMGGNEAAKIIEWLLMANPEMAMVAIDASGVEFDDKLKLTIREILLPQITDLDQHPEAGARSAIARGLGRVTLRNGNPLDNRPGVGLNNATPTIEWIYLSGGPVELEGVDGNVKGVNIIVNVKSFLIAYYPVANLQFEAFIDAADGYTSEEWWEGIERSLEPFSPEWTVTNFPRASVSWYEAVAFCRWLTARYRNQGLLTKNQEIRLPTEWEWQFAATDGNRYNIFPWGPKWDRARSNCSSSEIHAPCSVGIYPQGTWPNGPADMAGNVWEWCLNKFQNPTVPQATSADGSGDDRTLRGGSFGSTPNECRSAERLGIAPMTRSDQVGFRLIQVVS
jgi:formylglycine-generating enzyme required for sulfatase activity